MHVDNFNLAIKFSQTLLQMKYLKKLKAAANSTEANNVKNGFCTLCNNLLIKTKTTVVKQCDA